MFNFFHLLVYTSFLHHGPDLIISQYLRKTRNWRKQCNPFKQLVWVSWDVLIKDLSKSVNDDGNLGNIFFNKILIEVMQNSRSYTRSKSSIPKEWILFLTEVSLSKNQGFSSFLNMGGGHDLDQTNSSLCYKALARRDLVPTKGSQKHLNTQWPVVKYMAFYYDFNSLNDCFRHFWVRFHWIRAL